MKKKIFNILLSICVIATMIIPVNIRAVESPIQVTFAWNCDGNICAMGDTISRFSERTVYRESSYYRDGGHEFNAAAASSYGKQNYRQQYYIFRDTVIDEIKSKGTWEALDETVHEAFEGNFVINYYNNDVNVHAIDPCGGNDGPKSVVHNGDRDFRLIVYDNGYVPVTFNVDPENYTYYLGIWDSVFTNPVYDVSGTTEAKPMDYTTYLLENRLSFSSDEITSIKALNVPNKAVTINKVDNLYTITFNSNFYSKVTFELTNRNGKKHYLRINRKFVDVATPRDMDPIDPNAPREAYAVFIYPAVKSYDDYDVIATITTDEGSTTRILTASNVKVMNMEGRVNEGKTFAAGFNLKKSYYALGMTKDVKSVNITITNKDATKGNVYGGTFGGNGEGVELDLTYAKRMFEAPRA